jgi:hypothetical protein
LSGRSARGFVPLGDWGMAGSEWRMLGARGDERSGAQATKNPRPVGCGRTTKRE